MGATRIKYQEAEFFLNKLDEHYYDDIQNMLAGKIDRPIFLYNLSAFLSAARSVTWIMRNEYATIPGWEQWFRGQAPEKEEAQLLSLFNQLRIKSEKIRPIRPGRAFRLEGDKGSPIERDPRLPRFHITITAVDPESGSGPVMAGEVVECSWTIDELDGADLVTACRRYLQSIGTLLEKCEAQFGSPT